jgi:15-cis-phytoene desaturase
MAVTFQSEALVIGAGLAGLSTALYLLDKGIRPTVIERNPYVGGRTSSWIENGMDVESGLHRYLGVYSEMPALLRMAGLELNDVIDWEDQIEIRVPHGPHATFGASIIHKPLKTVAGAIGNNDFLAPSDKLSLSAFITAGLKDYVTNPEMLDTKTVQQYAEEHHITKLAMDRVLVAITEGLFFLTPRVYSAYAFFGLIAPYWKKLPAVRIGAFSGGMSEVMAQPLADTIIDRGGTVITGVDVERIVPTNPGYTVITNTAKTYAAKSVILAASLGPAQQIIRQSFANNDRFEPMLSLSSVPSVTFQLELTKPAMPIDRTTFGPMTALGSFTEQSRTTFKGKPGRLSIILTSPERFLHLNAESILDIVISEAETLGLHLKGIVKQYRKIVIPQDFYLLSPGAEALRPQSETSLPGLYVAGDYTKQKYLTTMEGAVYSGRHAASLVAKYLAIQ